MSPALVRFARWIYLKMLGCIGGQEACERSIPAAS